MKNANTKLAAAAKPPSDRVTAKQLGPANGAFRVLMKQHAADAAEWRRYSTTSPWVLKVTRGERTLFYATPKVGELEVTVVLGERAVTAALGGRVRSALHESIRSARRYVEGRPVRVSVKRESDVAAVEELVEVKLKPAEDTR